MKKNDFVGTYEWALSNTWKPDPRERVHMNNDVSNTLLASGNHNGVVEREYEVCDFRYDEGLRTRVDTQVVPTLTTHSSGVSGAPMVMENTNYKDIMETKNRNLRIRKLTPRECWRLMGFSERREDGSWDDSAFDAASKVNSNAQLYKQAGNSIVVDCLEAIFQNLFLEPDHKEYKEISLF